MAHLIVSSVYCACEALPFLMWRNPTIMLLNNGSVNSGTHASLGCRFVHSSLRLAAWAIFPTQTNNQNVSEGKGLDLVNSTAPHAATLNISVNSGRKAPWLGNTRNRIIILSCSVQSSCSVVISRIFDGDMNESCEKSPGRSVKKQCHIQAVSRDRRIFYSRSFVWGLLKIKICSLVVLCGNKKKQISLLV